MSGEAEARALLVPKPGAGRTGIYIEGVRRAVERIPQKPQCSALSGRLPVRHGQRALGARAYLPPCMNAFVGADITCAVLASGMCQSPETALLCDLGTNGELALWSGGRLYVASTAEGLSPGAVEAVYLAGGLWPVPPESF